MFFVRETQWHGLGVRVNEAPASRNAWMFAGLDWSVVQEPVYTETGELVEGYKANIRDADRKMLGVVTDRYKVIQNREEFAFTDGLLGEGVRYETAGSLQGGHYMSVCNADAWYIAVLIYGREFKYYRLEWDESMMEDLIQIEQDFWENHVQKGILPEPDGSELADKVIA